MGLSLSPVKSAAKSWSAPPLLTALRTDSAAADEEEDGCRTPTSREFRIQVNLACPPPPPPPKRPKPSRCRNIEASAKVKYFNHPDLESIFIVQYNNSVKLN
ncbi:hypothetical protein M569_07640 [Genlisea aurea]|uniref:Uncharacterized protein n=1 Tax=Genlisea aurea TaxID=192259 RepID=S8DVD2_9LAMI|nr:hypothetical protein M569_07640 [Genlisea aurea]